MLIVTMMPGFLVAAFKFILHKYSRVKTKDRKSKMGKGGKEGKDDTMNDSQAEAGPSYEEKLKFVSCIAKPMASKKLAKKVYKVSFFWPTSNLIRTRGIIAICSYLIKR